MPELPDLTVYVESINERLEGSTLDKMIIASLFLTLLGKCQSAARKLKGG